MGYTLNATSPTTYETSLGYTCASGFTGDAGAIVCQADGYWSGATGCARVGEYRLYPVLTNAPYHQYQLGESIVLLGGLGVILNLYTTHF